MATKVSVTQPITTTPGVQPITDRTAYSTPHYTFSDKIRFWRGIPQKIGGWRNFPFSNNITISGVARTLYSTVLSGIVKSLIGTQNKLYYLKGQTLTNITPLQTATIAIANSLTSDYGTLANNPISVVNGSMTITIADTNAAKYAVGDIITTSGATATGGVPVGDLNAAHVIRSIGTNNYTTYVATEATSTATGGGNAVVRATGRITIAATAHGQANGDRVGITGAATFAGINNTSINQEFLIRNVTTNSFDIFTGGIATSSVSAGGGAATLYQKEIPVGAVNASFGQGYGMGRYGMGRYGVSKSSTQGITYPRIWFMDRFADTVILTPGNQTGVYAWHGNEMTAPQLLANAPTQVNYVFVSNNIVVTLGAGGFVNRIFSSDIGDPTIWTGSSTNQVFDDDIEGAGQFISHIPVSGVNLLYTMNQTYLFSYIGQPLIWNIQLLDNSIGIIGPMARCSVNNTAFWMSDKNFYFWTGGNISVIPANSQDESTMLDYVFNNINTQQAYKSFAWYNKQFNEVWFHYPSASSNECDRIARVSIIDMTWSPDTFDRSCAEYPSNFSGMPRLISPSGTFYIHEYGINADGLPMPFTLTTNLRNGGKNSFVLSGFIPDSVTSGTMQCRVQTYDYPQSAIAKYDKTFDVDAAAGQIPIGVGGRYWKYTWSGSVLGQDFIMGNWTEYDQQGSSN